MYKYKKIILSIAYVIFSGIIWILFYKIDLKYSTTIPKLFWILLIVIYFIMNAIGKINRAKLFLIFALCIIVIQLILYTFPQAHSAIYNFVIRLSY